MPCPLVAAVLTALIFTALRSPLEGRAARLAPPLCPGFVLGLAALIERIVPPQAAPLGELHAAELLPVLMLHRVLGDHRSHPGRHDHRAVVVGNHDVAGD